MSTVTVTTTPTVLDAGTAYDLSLVNSGSLNIQVTVNGGSVGNLFSQILRPGQQVTVYPHGYPVSAFTASGTSSVDVTLGDNPQLNASREAAQDALGAGALVKTANLSDLANPGTARTNLGLGTAATHPDTDFLTPSAASATYPTVVAHGSTAGTARPSAALVWWFGTVYPTNAASGDILWNTTQHTVQRFNGSRWDPYPNADNASVIDFRKLPDGASSTVTTTKGKFVAFNTLSPLNFTVSSGRLVSSSNTNVVYLEVGPLDDTVQHAWTVVEFAALGSLTDNSGVLIGLPNPPSWLANTLSMGIHAQLFGKVSGAAAGNLTPGTYNTTGTKSPTNVNLGYTFPGRTVRYDVTVDKTNGHVRYYVDGVQVLEYVDAAILTYIGTTALLEFANPGIKIVEFGASTELPLHLMRVTPGADINPFAAGLGALNVATGTGGGSAGAAASEWKLIRTIPVAYDYNGQVEISWSPYIICTSGTVFMELGPATGGPDTASYYKTKVCEATTKGRVQFTQVRTGTPNTTETVGIYGIVSSGGAATVGDSTYSGTGPRWVPVGNSVAMVQP